MGGQIVWHSFRLLFGNVGNALRVSVGPYAIGLAICAVVLLAAGVPLAVVTAGAADPAASMQGGLIQAVAMLLCLLVLMFVSGWVAVAWHRFVLLEEYPGVLPAVAGRPVWPYVGRVILLSLVLMLAAIPLAVVIGFLAVPLVGSASNGGGIAALLAIGLVTAAVLSFLWMRLGLILPATAVGRPVTMGESWRRTGPWSGAILIAVLVIIALNTGTGLLFGLVLGAGVVSAVLSLVVDWISIMVGISLLTTLYGVIVEGRTMG